MRSDLLTDGYQQHYYISLVQFLLQLLLYVAGIEVLVGSLLYKYQHKEIFSILAKDPKNEYPTEKLELSYGFYTSVTSGALYGFVVVFELVVLIKNHVKYEKEANAVRSLN